MLSLVLWTLLAGAAIPAGGLLAAFERIRPRWLEREVRHSVIAFGGGVLLAAATLVLVPQGIHAVPGWLAPLLLVLGGAAFMGLDQLLAERSGTRAQLVAMLADFMPEAAALGATFASDRRAGVYLAVLIALQNLPEGFNAYREIRAGSAVPKARLLMVFSCLAVLGPVIGLLGHAVLSPDGPLLGGTMLVAAGGILYLMFQDIAPQVRLQQAFAPPLGAVLGYGLGVLGHVWAGP
ncbi:MAG: divalent cation transporter [Phycisphaerales bacterium]|nr:MAG: divalent cation transporter [Phycisphaerales bacterium]